MVCGGCGIDGDCENVLDCEFFVILLKGSQLDIDILDNRELQMLRNDFFEYVN